MAKLIVGFSTRKKKNIITSLIQFFDNAPFDHVFTMVDDKVFQANFFGVGIVPFSEFSATHEIVETIGYDLTPEQALKYEGFVNGCVGKEYSQMQFLWIAANKYFHVNVESKNGTSKYICSELVADTLSFVLGFNFHRVHDYITPRWLRDFLKGL